MRGGRLRAHPASDRSADARGGEGGIRTLDGGIHPHNALAGRRLQPLGHFSASLRRIADPDSRIPLRGEESTPGSTKMSLPAPPSYPRQSETRLRLPEAGFAFQGDYDTVIVSFIPAASWPGIVQYSSYFSGFRLTFSSALPPGAISLVLSPVSLTARSWGILPSFFATNVISPALKLAKSVVILNSVSLA